MYAEKSIYAIINSYGIYSYIMKWYRMLFLYHFLFSYWHGYFMEYFNLSDDEIRIIEDEIK